MADACLGSGEYVARIVRRRTHLGPAFARGELAVESGSWGRTIQATTDASVSIHLDAAGCEEVLGSTMPWWDELELLRDGRLVWAGPIQNVTATPADGLATVAAKDSSAWWAKRVLAHTFTHRDVDLATIFQDYLNWSFGVDDPGMEVIASPVGITGDRTVVAGDLKKLDAELGELARTGVDWTVAGRTWFVGGLTIGGETSMLPTRLFDDSFSVPPQIRRSGDEQTNEAYVRGNAVTGRAGGPDPQDGVLLQDVRDEQSIEDQGSADAAARTWRDRVAEAMIYVEGENVLEPSSAVDTAMLIPGVLVPVDLDGARVVPYRGVLRLESVSVSFDAGGESVSVALQPPGTTTGEVE